MSDKMILVDIEDLHRQAVLCKSNTYVDPSTGFTVFTEYAHLKRKICCGNRCRHCPYGWENVVDHDAMKENQSVTVATRCTTTAAAATATDSSAVGSNSDGGIFSKVSLSKVKPLATGMMGSSLRPVARVKSGQRKEIVRLLEKIDEGTYFDDDMDMMDVKSCCQQSWVLVDEKKDNVSCLSPITVMMSSNTSSTSSSSSCCSDSGRDSGSGSRCDSAASSDSESSNKSDDCSTNGGNLEPSNSRRQTFTSKNVPYTRTGDTGTSMLLTGERRSKDDEAFEAMGTVDELCSTVGLVHAELGCTREDTMSSRPMSKESVKLQQWLVEVMSRLFDIGSHLAKPTRRKLDVEEDCGNHHEDEVSSKFQGDGVGNGFQVQHIQVLEEWIDSMTEQMPELLHFILPTGSRASAQMHVARCVCRRAERRVQPLVRDGVCDPNAAKYLNRLSDFLFTAARYCNYLEGKDEVQYKRPIRGAKQRNCVTIHLRDDEKKT